MFTQWPFAKDFPTGANGMVAAKHPLAAQAGVQMLRRGGSAVDAIVATSLASGVVEPYMSGIGGGGLAVYQQAGQPPRALHFGMQAATSDRPDMYEVLPGTHDKDLFGWPRTRGDANLSGPMSIAIPGLVPGLYRLWQAGGTLPWADLVTPAIQLAGEFEVDWMTSLRILQGHDLLMRFPTSRAVFLSRGRPPLPEYTFGAEILRQPDLARTLRALADNPGALATDPQADELSRSANGRFTSSELQDYEPLEGAPLTLAFGSLEIHLAPWATGGTTAYEWLGILEHLDPPEDDHDVNFWWRLVKSGQVALHDRLEHVGDPDFVSFPSHLFDPGYHGSVARSIVSGEVEVSLPVPPAAGSTTHLAAADSEGNVVSVTQTLLSLWGSGVVAGKTGICMNNGMMWFDPEPGRANSVAGGKRPLANMCPVLATRNGVPVLAFGASGGRRIMPAVVQILARMEYFGESLSHAMSAPRLEISGQGIVADVRFGEEFARDLARRLGQPVTLKRPNVAAAPWASPVGLMRLDDRNWTGGGDLYSMACVLKA